MQKDIFEPVNYLPGHQASLIDGGPYFFAKAIEIIDRAKWQLHFQVYIFEEDETGISVAKALKRATQRGVEVFLLLDSYGSKKLSEFFIADLINSGIQFRFFSPLPEHYYVLRLGRRLHCKVIVADGIEALVGGINIADKYQGTPVQAPWLDFAVWVKGGVCLEIARVCDRIYREKYFGLLNVRRPRLEQVMEGKLLVKFALNDWFRRRRQISDGYKAAFRQSQSHIIIVASYFLPSRNLRSILKKARQRGVKITVFLPGESDLIMAKRATRYLYQWLLKYNIAIFEWNHSILHGKMAVVDGRWVTVGSYNLNHLSQYSSIEMNLEILDEAFAFDAKTRLQNLMLKASEVHAEQFVAAQGIVDRFLDWASYLLARWIMNLLFVLVLRDQKG